MSEQAKAEWAEVIRRAEVYDACEDGLAWARQFETLAEAVESEDFDAPSNLCWYAVRVLQGRWPEAEPKILQVRVCAFDYACGAIKGRWPEAEPVIATDAFYAYIYARDAIKGRWLEAEPVIAKSNCWAARYARDVIKGPWPEAGVEWSVE